LTLKATKKSYSTSPPFILS